MSLNEDTLLSFLIMMLIGFTVVMFSIAVHDSYQSRQTTQCLDCLEQADRAICVDLGDCPASETKE